MKRGKNSRGLSRIALNLIIVLLIIIIAGVIFLFAKDIFNRNPEKDLVNKMNLSVEIDQVKILNETDLSVSLKKEIEDENISSVIFTIYNENNSELIKYSLSMEELKQRNLKVILSVVNTSKIRNISIERLFKIEPENVGNIIKNESFFNNSDFSGGGGSSGGSETGDGENNEENVDINIEQQQSICGDVLDYQCGTKTICNSNINYGNCPTGYSCTNNLCIASVGSCSGVSCDSGEYCSNGVCLLTVSGNTYFVAIWGNDSWLGNFTHPFATWQKAVLVSLPGDITYFKGGVWEPATRVTTEGFIGMLIRPGSNIGKSGTSEAPIRYYNYPGEKPILDGSLIGPNANRWSYGIGMDNVEYIYLKGLTVRHIHQSPPNFSHVKPYSEVYGIGCSPCANMFYENLVVHDIDGRGFQHWSGAWTALDGPNAYFESDNTSWINCDAYNLYDRYASQPGNAADGWKVGTYYGNYMYWEGCRAFNYSDDGFDPHGGGYRTFKNCWAMSSDRYKGISENWDPEGNGFKMTGVDPTTSPGYFLGKNFVRVENSIAAYCDGAGFVNNILVNFVNNWPNGGLLYNNLVYRCGYGYWDSNGSTLMNNIVYDSENIGPTGEKYEIVIANENYTAINNTWIKYHTPGSSWPWWKYNPLYNVTDDDFESLDYWQLMRPRKSDNSLPDITFGHLKSNSELVDAGTIIPGYHCATSGYQEGCAVWYGSAPDIGAFEYS